MAEWHYSGGSIPNKIGKKKHPPSLVPGLHSAHDDGFAIGGSETEIACQAKEFEFNRGKEGYRGDRRDVAQRYFDKSSRPVDSELVIR